MSDSDNNTDRESDKSKAFTLMAERIANSRATVETENYTISSPSGNDTYSTFHKKHKSGGDETNSQMYKEDDNGVFKAFKDGKESTENKQLPLASNAVTNDTDVVTGTNSGPKKVIVGNDFEEIKEEDENNESYDARKQFENIDYVNSAPEFELAKYPASANVPDLELGDKNDKENNDEQEYSNTQETKEDEEEDDDNDLNMLNVEQKFCTV